MLVNELCLFFSYYLQVQGISRVLRQYENLQQFSLLDSDGNSLIGGQLINLAIDIFKTLIGLIVTYLIIYLCLISPILLILRMQLFLEKTMGFFIMIPNNNFKFIL